MCSSLRVTEGGELRRLAAPRWEEMTAQGLPARAGRVGQTASPVLAAAPGPGQTAVETVGSIVGNCSKVNHLSHILNH